MLQIFQRTYGYYKWLCKSVITTWELFFHYGHGNGEKRPHPAGGGPERALVREEKGVGAKEKRRG